MKITISHFTVLQNKLYTGTSFESEVSKGHLRQGRFEAAQISMREQELC